MPRRSGEPHRALGPGLLESSYLESSYEECLLWELREASLRVRRQVGIALVYKGVQLDYAYRIDMVVEECVVVEVKAIDRVLPVHEAQLLTYLRLSGVGCGLLLNSSRP